MGSSPLARGLQFFRTELLKPRGIIPARAGFTRMGCTAGDIDRDHPRSRGVYHVDVLAGYGQVGSSPLARGLLCRLFRCDLAYRIIPARAGFTLETEGKNFLTQDHPRSRGVYSWSMCPLEQVLGSSPLARGLPVAGDGSIWPWGIIPARAGFTPRGRTQQIVARIIPARAGFTRTEEGL